jgi:hypothetical protein
MSSQLATVVVLGAAFIGAVVWVVSFLKAWRSASLIEEGETALAGEATLEGEPEEVSKKIARSLVGGPSHSIIQVRVVDAGPSGVRVRTPKGGALMPMTGGLEGEFKIRRAADGKVKVALRTNKGAERRAAKITMWICLLIGLPVLVGVPALLMALVVASPHPAVRWQSIQVVQIVHVLWPPFLFLWLGRRTQRVIEEGLGQVLDRLKYG